MTFGLLLNLVAMFQSSVCDQLSRALICIEAGGFPAEKMQKNMANLEKVLEKAHGVRWLGTSIVHHHTHAIKKPNWDLYQTLGSAAIDLAMVAAGQADAYFHAGIHCWDMAAGALLVREAGGVVQDPSGGEFAFLVR